MSDAYYSRALAYRDIGEVKLADADEATARELDEVLHDVYKRLPEPPAPTGGVAKAQAEEEAAQKQEAVTKSEADQRKLYQKLKKQFEPGFGTIRSPKKTEDANSAAQLHEDRKDLYHSLMAPPAYPRSADADQNEVDADVLGGVDVSKPLDDDAKHRGAGFVPGPMTTARPLTLPTPPGQRRHPRGTAATSRDMEHGNLQSPFPQHTPAPTGYVEPLANPFAPPSRSATGTSSSTISRPFNNGPAYSNPYSNPAVRPMNPRDYVP